MSVHKLLLILLPNPLWFLPLCITSESPLKILPCALVHGYKEEKSQYDPLLRKIREAAYSLLFTSVRGNDNITQEIIKAGL